MFNSAMTHAALKRRSRRSKGRLRPGSQNPLLLETRNHIQNRIALALALEKGSLIDFETTGFPWDPRSSHHEIVTLGYLSGNTIVVTQRKTKDKSPFYSEIDRIISKLPKPFFAYNVGFEKAMLEIELDRKLSSVEIVDIMGPWKDKAETMGIKMAETRPAHQRTRGLLQGEQTEREGCARDLAALPANRR